MPIMRRETHWMTAIIMVTLIAFSPARAAEIVPAGHHFCRHCDVVEFESPPYQNGVDINGVDGWVSTGSGVVLAPAAGVGRNGSQALRDPEGGSSRGYWRDFNYFGEDGILEYIVRPGSSGNHEVAHEIQLQERETGRIGATLQFVSPEPNESAELVLRAVGDQGAHDFGVVEAGRWYAIFFVYWTSPRTGFPDGRFDVSVWGIDHSASFMSVGMGLAQSHLSNLSRFHLASTADASCGGPSCNPATNTVVDDIFYHPVPEPGTVGMSAWIGMLWLRRPRRA